MIEYTDSVIKSVVVSKSHDYRPYGGNIRTDYMVDCTDGRKRRVYAMSYGNSASFYLRMGGKDVILGTEDEHRLEGVR